MTMSRYPAVLLAAFLVPSVLLGRLEPTVCGTHADKTQEELFLHKQAARRRPSGRTQTPAVLPPRDAGNIALIDDSNGVIGRSNPFDLNGKTLRFTPSKPQAAGYRFELGDASYDAAAAASGAPVKLADDDSRPFDLPFPFPFFGATYRQIFVNSDGNATFTAGDADATDRSFGRFTGGLPRIAPLFTDLDPSAVQHPSTEQPGVFVTSEPGRFVVSWVKVPLYSQSGTGRAETFQMQLFADGRIEFAWSDVFVSSAVVGIAPGRLQGPSTVLSFTAGSTQQFSGAVGERFSAGDSVDIVTAAQQFYASHEDAYDYLVIFNAENVEAAPGAVAYEVTVRNQRSGYGDSMFDNGQDFGSAGRLQAVLNMGPLSQYPVDPNAVVPARFLSRDTPMTVLGHEAGHLFLAYASVKDPNDAGAKPMLGRQLAHWSFLFNSEASFLEGNRIRDDGPNASPRFTTVATVQGYAPLDQYLMGFRAPEEVSPTYLVSDSPNISSAIRSPQVGVAFDGKRRDIAIQEVIDAVGRRTPDYTVSQRRFRFAFLLIVPAGQALRADQIAQLETYRSLFEGFYRHAASDRATAEASLKRALHLSTFPAAGLLYGGLAAASITLDTPAAAPLIVLLDPESGAVDVPRYTIIPAGETRGDFFMLGLRPGVDTLAARPLDSGYETAISKIQVAESAAGLQLKIISSDPIVLRATDINDLPYPNIVVKASVTKGSLESNIGIADANGLIRFRWVDPGGVFTAAIVNGGPAVEIRKERADVGFSGLKAGCSSLDIPMWGRMASCGELVIRLELLKADFQSAAGYQPAPRLPITKVAPAETGTGTGY